MREQDDLLNMTEEDRQRVLAVEKMRTLIEEGVNKKCLLSEQDYLMDLFFKLEYRNVAMLTLGIIIIQYFRKLFTESYLAVGIFSINGNL